jgi:hypothetical protein
MFCSDVKAPAALPEVEQREGGAYANQLNLAEDGKAQRGQAKVFKPDLGNPAVRIIGGPRETSPWWVRLHQTAGAPELHPDQ